MNSKTFEILMEEHKNIIIIAEALEKECNLLTEGKQINKVFFESVIDFIKNYADKFHHAKEEDLLFKEFSKSAERGGAHCNPVEQMLIEHDEGRKAVKLMREGLREEDKEKIIKGGLNYVDLIREHIFKEDNILYPLAEEVLKKDQKDKLVQKFEDIEKTIDARHLEFLNHIKNTKQKKI